MKMDGPVFEEKPFFKMLGLSSAIELDLGYWHSYKISIVITASKIIGALIHSMKFFSAEAALYPYKSTTQPCM